MLPLHTKDCIFHTYTTSYQIVPLLSFTENSTFRRCGTQPCDEGDDTIDQSGNDNAKNTKMPPFLQET